MIVFAAWKDIKKRSAEKSIPVTNTQKNRKQRQQNKKGSPVAICSNDHKLFFKPTLLCLPEEWPTVNCVMYSWWMFNFIKTCDVTSWLTHLLLCAEMNNTCHVMSGKQAAVCPTLSEGPEEWVYSPLSLQMPFTGHFLHKASFSASTTSSCIIFMEITFFLLIQLSVSL